MKNLRKDIPNEGRNNILMFLFGIAFLMLAAKCTGQTVELTRADNYDDYLHRPTKRIYPKDALTFRSPINEKDTIYLSILADSVQVNAYSIKLYAFFPNTIDVRGSKRIIVTFTDKSVSTFKMCLATKEGDFNYMEYYLDEHSYTKLHTLKVINIEFESVYKYKIYEDDLFIAFLNSYAKN